MGPKYNIQTGNSLYITKHSYGVKSQYLIPHVSLDIYEKLSTIAFKRPISINFFVLPNTLFLKYLFQMGPFETNLFHADLFYIDKIRQTRPK